MAIWRYTSTGVLDTTFNGTGYITTNLGNGGDVGNDIVMDSSGNILVSGQDGSNMVIWRYLTGGSLDTTFGGGTGYVSYAIHNNNATGNGITLDNSGNILVTGGGSNNMTIWRYTPGGSLDTTFNGTGYVSSNLPSSWSQNSYGWRIKTDNCGRILVVGYEQGTDYYEHVVIWRYNADGTPDNTFNGGINYIVSSVGTVLSSPTGGEGSNIFIDSSNNIFVTGGANSNMILWKYKNNCTCSSIVTNEYPDSNIYKYSAKYHHSDIDEYDDADIYNYSYKYTISDLDSNLYNNRYVYIYLHMDTILYLFVDTNHNFDQHCFADDNYYADLYGNTYININLFNNSYIFKHKNDNAFYTVTPTYTNQGIDNNYFRLYSYRGLLDEKVKYDDYTSLLVVRNYGISFFRNADVFKNAGQQDAAGAAV